MAANLDALLLWSARTGDVTDILTQPLPVNYGFEELDASGDIMIHGPPPDYD